MTRYLLDTHVALWWADGSPRLSRRHRQVLEAGDNEVYLSVVSVWEAAIKASQGKLQLPDRPQVFFPSLVERSSLKVLPVHLSHAAMVYTLPQVHGDPFDRLLVCQCRIENLTLLSDDHIFKKYELPALI